MRNVHLLRFLKNPFPLWETKSLAFLIDEIEKQSTKYRVSNYSNAIVLSDNLSGVPSGACIVIDSWKFFVEFPGEQTIKIYRDWGLDPAEKVTIGDNEYRHIQSAMRLFLFDKNCLECIHKLVRSITIVRSEGPEYDASYSQPSLPFSIFFSVNDSHDKIASLRTAESILHETMHLKLSLIENIIPLIQDVDTAFFSPWREEMRPIGGVLHGLFVFTAVLSFYDTIRSHFSDKESLVFIDNRRAQIKEEANSIVLFAKSPGLTSTGRELVKRLFRYCND